MEEKVPGRAKARNIEKNEKIDKIGMYKSESLVKHTKRTWDQWIELLNNSGAANLDHREIAAWLEKKYKLTAWWKHIVAGGFEIHIGRKVEGRNAKGRWSLTATKSLHRSDRDVWKLLVSEEGQAIWLKPLDSVSVEPQTTFETLDGFFGEFRTMKAARRLRFSWSDPEWDRPSYVQMIIVKRPGEKCLLAFMHGEIPDSRSRDQMRTRWRDVLETIAAMTEKSGIKGRSSERTRPRSR